MKKTIDKFAIYYDENNETVTVASQIYLVRTDKPEEAVVAFDAKQLKYTCDLEECDFTSSNGRYSPSCCVLILMASRACAIVVILSLSISIYPLIFICGLQHSCRNSLDQAAKQTVATVFVRAML